MSKLETHAKAWNRVYNYRSTGKGWQSDTDCPIRLRGYTELILGALPDKLRKKIDTAIKRGYMLENRTNLPAITKLILSNNPFGHIPIGYIGKTDLEVFIPTIEGANDLVKELKAITVMTEVFKGDTLGVADTEGTYKRVYANPSMRKDVDRRSSVAHLRPCFTELRPAIDEWLAKDAAVRERIANWAANDTSIIRIPFDSHKEIDNE